MDEIGHRLDRVSFSSAFIPNECVFSLLSPKERGLAALGWHEHLAGETWFDFVFVPAR